MIKAAAIAALSIPVFSIANAEYTADLQNSREQADAWSAKFEQVSAELKELGIKLREPDAPCEIPETEDTVVVADQGLLFDSASSRLIYIGNVRLRDERAHINAAEQLHLHLEYTRKEAPADTPDATAPADSPVEAAEEEAAEEDELLEDADAPASEADVAEEAPVADEEAATDEEEETAEAPAPKPAEPAYIDTHCGIADTISNAILLYSPTEGQAIHLKQGENEVQISPTAEKPARILADPQGNILLEGDLINLRMVDKEGGITTLCSKGGHAYYHAATHSLYVPGSSELTHPDGSLSCSNMLCVVLAPSAQATKRSKGFMSQFTNLRFDGISTATATGQVVATGVAAEGRPATKAVGDKLFYNGSTGECSLTGSQCSLVYGNYELYSNEGVHLLPNGDIELRGSNIHGTYERESSQPGTMLKGTFKAHAPVVFRADQGTVSTSNGLSIADDEADFSCTGPAHLVLAPKENAKEPETKPGMPNLAITRYGDIARARATGNVVVHRFDAATRKCIGELQARTADFDITTGETLLTGEPGQPLVAQYNGNTVVATPDDGESATMEMRANGDLKLNGARIAATLLTDEGTTTASCEDYVLLVRAEDRLETGSSTVLKSPRAIVTTNGCLHALLTAKEGSTASTGKSKFPGFRFNYNGIREARTNEGCTARTEKGSMQCNGPAHILMDTENKGADSMMGGMKYATATGKVAVAGKDKSGRLVRASGDRLEVDAATGMKVLSGQKVVLSDANNTHTIYGPGAVIRIDAQNNISFTGARHNTRATNIKEQMNNQDPKSSKK